MFRKRRNYFLMKLDASHKLSLKENIGTRNRKMELYSKEIETLAKLKDEKIWPYDTSNANKKTLNALHKKGLIKNTFYTNGYNWEMTDKGFYYLNEKTKK